MNQTECKNILRLFIKYVSEKYKYVYYNTNLQEFIVGGKVLKF